jgi:hypothetical protein
MAALNSTTERIIQLLGGSTDEHCLAGLTLLSKLTGDLPPPSLCANALNPRGLTFLKRLISTGMKDPSKRGYLDISLSTYQYILGDPNFRLNSATTAALLSVLDLTSPEDTSRRELAIENLSRGLSSPIPSDVVVKVVKTVVGLEISKAKCETTEEWMEANLAGLLGKCELFILEGAGGGGMDQLDPFLAFLKISTNLELSLNLLNSLLMCGKESTLMKKFSSKLPSVCRRLLVTGLRLDALDKPDKTQSPRDVALALLGRLLETCGGKWILDPAADNNPLKICARVACGEVRTE